jgi:hypothetical protein
MSVHGTILTSLPGAGTTLRQRARRTWGDFVDRGVVIRAAGYRTRLSAKRLEAGCATERVSSTGELARRTRMTRSARGRKNGDALDARMQTSFP